MSTPFYGVSDNAISQLANSGDLNNTTSPITVSLTTGTGSIFPSVFPFPMSISSTVDPTNDTSTRELAWCTAKSGDSVTLTRPNTVAHPGTPYLQRAWTAEDVAQITNAITHLETTYADTGAANAYVVAIEPTPATLASIQGLPIRWTPANANTGASTLTVGSLTATAIRKQGGTALASGDIVAGQPVVTVYDGTYHQLVGGVVGSGAEGDGVSSLAESGQTGMTGAVTLSAGANVTLTQTTGNIEIAASGGSSTASIPLVSPAPTTAPGSGDPQVVRTADGTIYVWSSTATAWIAHTANGGLSADLLPWLIDIDPYMTPVAQVGTFAILSGAALSMALVHNFIRYNSSNAQNDELDYDVVLAAGTWTIETMHITASDNAIITVNLGSTTVGTYDAYSSGMAGNVCSAITGIAVATTAKYRLRLIAATRNGSNTTGWSLNLQHLQLRRTA